MYLEMLERASAIVAVGTPLERFARTIMPGGHDAKVTVIPNGVDLEKIQAAMTRAPRAASGTELISVANLWKLKGIDYTLRALAELDRRGMRDWRYTIVGDGPERRALETLARESGLSGRVSFRGALDHRQALEAIAQSDIFVLPSWNEAFGLVYLEAMACGKPVIGCRGQGAQDLLAEARTGLLVEPKDVSSLAAALACLLRDPALGREMGLAGRRAAHNFTWNACAERYAALYAKCTSTFSESKSAALGLTEMGTGERVLVNEHG
jgi:glycosyltransferase involved in cell wall biosynthesis